MRFLASLRNDSGVGIMAFALPGTTSTVASTNPRCHLDRRERSHAVIIRSEKSIFGNTRFLASLRNDSGGGISSSALPGTTRFLAIARNDKRGRLEMTTYIARLKVNDFLVKIISPYTGK